MTRTAPEVHKLTTFDGEELFFQQPDFKLIAYGGYGAPPTNYSTRRGYKQHGVTEVDYLLDPRQIELTFWHSPACDRQAYWDTRFALHEIFRPNRGGELMVTFIMPNGDQRALMVRADPGLEFPAEEDNHWAINEQVNFTAFDPIWFDPDTTNTDILLTESINTDLVFPFTFPFTFGTSGLIFSSGVITYPGTWRTYPTITLTGPYTSARITNLDTGAVITMVVPTSAGDTRILDLTPGNQSIVDSNGVSRYNELGTDSNLIAFNIRPDPEVTDGQQTIQVIMQGGSSGQSTARLTYYNRYFAL